MTLCIMSLDTDKFIIEIEKRVELWDTASPNYANKIIKQNSWLEICRLFHEGYDSMATNQQKEVCKYSYDTFTLYFKKVLIYSKQIGNTYIILYFNSLIYFLLNYFT